MAAASAGQQLQPPSGANVAPIIVSQPMQGTVVSQQLSSHLHSAAQAPIQRITYVQRVPSHQKNNLENNFQNVNQEQYQSNVFQSQQQQQLQHQQQQQQQLQHQQQQQHAFLQDQQIHNYNLAPGWRRLVSNGEIIYISPSGATLRNIVQVKDYLLSVGTCKCGLPCPIRPESFFEFNIQIPTIQLPSTSNDNISSSCCSHQRRILASQEITNNRGDTSILDEKTKPIQNVILPPGVRRVVQGAEQIIYEQTEPNVKTSIRNSQWKRVNVNQTINPQNVPPNAINGRVPPLPQQHTAPTYVWQDESVQKQQLIKGKMVKKRPSFKEDPTGYLNHQTAILHNSISTLHSPNADPSKGDRKTESPPVIVKQDGQVFVEQSYSSQRIQDVPNKQMGTKHNYVPNESEEVITGQTVTQIPNGIVQNCDIRQIKHQIQHQIEQRNRFIKQQGTMIMNRNIVKQDTDNSKSQYIFVQSPLESPVSSSTTLNRGTPETRSTSSTPDSKGPVQGPGITTSNDNMCTSSPSPSPEYVQGSAKTVFCPPKLQATGMIHGQAIVRNTTTSVVAGKPMTTTTNAALVQQIKQEDDSTQQIIHPSGTIVYRRPAPKQMSSTIVQNIVPAGTNIQQLNLQNIQRNEQGQFIITPSSQVVMMPTGASSKGNNQIIVQNNSNGSQQNIVHINQNTANSSGSGQFVQSNIVINNEQQNLLQSPNSSVLIQNSNVLQSQQNFIQSPNNIITTNNGSNYVINSSGGNMQPVILNNSGNILQTPAVSNILTSSNTNLITAAPSASPKVIQSSGNTMQVIHNPSSSMNQQIIAQQPNGQTVVLNTLPNGMIIQQPTNITTVDGQVVNRIIQDSSGNIIQQTGSQILLSPDSKRKGKKRKNSCGSITPQGLSPQGTLQLSPTVQQASPQTATQGQSNMLQVNAISPQYQGQSFQLSPGLSGLTIVPKSQQQSQPQQQILLQNGQTIIQPLGLLGQQLLVPAGLVVTPDTTLVQIQNMGQIITPQGMVIRAQSPQQKQFLSPNTGQYIVSGNGQVSPMGQIYGSSVGLVQVPHSNNTGTTNIIQSNVATTIMQQQHQQQQQHQHQQSQQSVGHNQQATSTIINSQGQVIQTSQGTTPIVVSSHSVVGNVANMKMHQDFLNAGHSVSTQTAQNQMLLQASSGQASPPDTTTHSPQSPDRPPSERSGTSYDGMAMVQCVSSSEPDSVVSPVAADSAQSPSQNTQIEYTERPTAGIQYHQPHHTTVSQNVYSKSFDTKIRRIQTPTQQQHMYVTANNLVAQHHTTSSVTTINQQVNNSSNIRPDSHESPSPKSNSPTQSASPVQTVVSPFAIDELVWGPARGHPAWPGKIVQSPSGVTTPHDFVWVRFFGGRPNIEMVSITGLKSLSEGLEAHHSALKDTRKGRKLNSQLERAIQEAMAELDRATSSHHSKKASNISASSSARGRGPRTSTHSTNQRKPVKIAPAPSTTIK